MSELRDDLKGSRGTIDGFSNQVDECRRSVAKESRALPNMHDSVGFESHQPGTGRVGGHRIISEHDLSQETIRAVERPVAFHCYNAVGDHEVHRNGGAKIEDALLNALPMENILWPSVSCARNNAKHVLHAESDARPVMGLYFRHGNEEIRFQHCAREPEMSHARIVRSQWGANQLVAIQI